MNEKITIDKTLEKIKTMYNYFEDSHNYILNCNMKYDSAYATSLSKFKKEKSNSYKILITNFISYDLVEIDKFIIKITHKIKLIRKFTLSELAHSKSKEIEFEMNNPFFFRKLHKYYRALNNDLSKLDENALNNNLSKFDENVLNDDIKNTINDEKFTLEFENVIERLKNLEHEIEDEKKSGLLGIIGKIFLWGIPILIGLYQLIAMKFFTINLYVPLALYIIALFIIYIFLKSVSDIKILYASIKYNKLRLIAPVLSFLVIGIVLYSILHNSIKYSTSVESIIPKFVFVFAFAVLMLFYVKEIIESTKRKIIQNELYELAIKYEIED